MRKNKILLYIILSIAVIISAIGLYVYFMPAEEVIEKWTGPGKSDGVIVPLRPEEDGVHREVENSKGYFELWYFDAHLEGGYLVVGFLHRANMIDFRPAAEINIYTPSGEKLSANKYYKKSDVRTSEKKCDVWVGKNHAVGSYPEYRLHIAEGELEANLTFHSELPGWKPGKGMTYYGDKGFFAWVVPVPRARVVGTIKIGGKVIPVKGTGYHDHNWGNADMKKIISHWYWGRLYTREFTLLYAYVVTNRIYGNVISRPLMLAHKDKIILSTGNMTLNENSFKFSSKANRKYPSHIDFSVPGKVAVTLDVKGLSDAHDLLNDIFPGMNSAFKWTLNRFARPGYFRFNSDFTLHIEHEGKTYDVNGKTLHEMVSFF